MFWIAKDTISYLKYIYNAVIPRNEGSSNLQNTEYVKIPRSSE